MFVYKNGKVKISSNGWVRLLVLVLRSQTLESSKLVKAHSCQALCQDLSYDVAAMYPSKTPLKLSSETATESNKEKKIKNLQC